MKVWYSIDPPRSKDIDCDDMIWIPNYTELRSTFPPVLYFRYDNNIRVRRKYYNNVSEFILCPSEENNYMMALEIVQNINTPVKICTKNIFTKLKIRKYMRKHNITECK